VQLRELQEQLDATRLELVRNMARLQTQATRAEAASGMAEAEIALATLALLTAPHPFFLDLPDVIAAADRYLPWLVGLPIVAVWSYLYDGVFVGATRAREMRDIMLISSFLVFVPAWYAFSFLGNHGLWLALSLFLAARGAGMHYYYRRRVLTAISA